MSAVINDKLVRATLWFSFPYNLVAAYALLFPAAPFGRLMGLPANVPPLYSSLLSFLIFAFGLLYACIASRHRLDRPLISFSAAAKAGVFVVTVALWLAGHAPLPAAAMVTGDLVLATVWGAWLIRK